MNKFLSRKLLVAVASVVGVDVAGMTDVQIICATVVAVAYLVMQGVVDRQKEAG